MNYTRIFTIASIAVIIFLSLSMVLGPQLLRKNVKTEQATLISASSVQPMPRFKLKTADGKPFTVDQLRGHWTLMFFGYSNCPDICPATLGLLDSTWKQYFKEQPAPVRFVFVSINPAVDRTNVLRKFMKRFHPDFKGVTGSEFEIQKVTHHLGVFAKQSEGKTASQKARIDHTAALMLINPQTKLHAIFTPPFEPKGLVSDLKIITQG